MKIVFMGTPEIAATALSELIKTNHQICCVVTQPDRPKGRGQKLVFSPVKELALKNDLAIEQPEKIKNNPVFASLLKSLAPDSIVVVAYGKILPKEILTIPKYGAINLHASLLPKYRGAAPVQWALINGEEETGVTIMQMDEKLDSGDILLQKKVVIQENENSIELLSRLAAVGGPLLIEALNKIEKGTIQNQKQDESQVSFAPLLDKMSAEIDWRQAARQIHNRIRALLPWPVCHTYHKEKILKIWESEVVAGQEKTLPGIVAKVIKDKGVVVGTGAGCLLLKKVQLEAGKVVSGYEFSLGHKVDKFPT